MMVTSEQRKKNDKDLHSEPIRGFVEGGTCQFGSTRYTGCITIRSDINTCGEL